MGSHQHTVLPRNQHGGGERTMFPRHLQRTAFAIGITLTMIAAGPLFAADQPPAARAEPGAAADARQDLLILGPLEPLRVRLLIEVDGIPFRQAWRNSLERLYDQLDTDRDGKLTATQMQTFLAAVGRASNRPLGPGVAAATKPSGAMMAPPADLSRGELLRQIASQLPPVTLRQRLASSGAGPALTPLLDADGDGRLSREELAAAALSLHCRDFNDDQLITDLELIAGPSLSGTNEGGGLEGSVLLLAENPDPAFIVETLLLRYDRNRDGQLSLTAPIELFSAGNRLQALDRDQNERLDRDELAAWLTLPFAAELPLQLGAGGAGRKAGTALPEYHFRRKLDGGYRLHVGNSEVDFRRNNRDPAQDGSRQSFRSLDADSNQSLDPTEFANIADRPEFDDVDTDHDGKLTEAEFDAFFSVRARLLSAQLVLEASDQGADLFTLLDRNFDRVLTPRELQNAPRLLDTEDRDHDGCLGGAEIAYTLILEVSRGGRASPNALQAQARGITIPQVKADRKGPTWFQKLDRNRDGDVSPAEFIGTRAQFSALDRDGDGLISPDEAQPTSTAP